MGRRFVPVPYEALEAAGGVGARCVLGLYQRAHVAMWRPFRLSVRDLARESGVGHTVAAQVLAELERLGLLHRDRSGSRSLADYVTVFDPSAEEAFRTPVPDTSADTRTRTATRPSGPAADTPADTGGGQFTRDRSVVRVGDHDHEHEAPPSVENTDTGAPTNGHRVEWDRAHAAYLEALEQLGRRRVPVKPSGAIGRALMARISDHGVEQIVALIRWWATSPHDRARFLREGGHGLETLTRAAKCEAYLRMIAEGGTTPPPRATGPPAYESFASMLAREAAASPLTLTLLPEEDPPDGH